MNLTTESEGCGSISVATVPAAFNDGVGDDARLRQGRRHPKARECRRMDSGSEEPDADPAKHSGRTPTASLVSGAQATPVRWRSDSRTSRAWNWTSMGHPPTPTGHPRRLRTSPAAPLSPKNVEERIPMYRFTRFIARPRPRRPCKEAAFRPAARPGRVNREASPRGRNRPSSDRRPTEQPIQRRCDGNLGVTCRSPACLPALGRRAGPKDDFSPDGT